MKQLAIAVMVLLCSGAALCGEDGPKLDATKYPQDTPENGAKSIIKAIDAGDLEYWVAHLITPTDTKRRVDKRGSIAEAAKFAGNSSKELKAMREVIEQMLKADKKTEGEEGGVKFTRYQLEEKVLQLEKQADGRWCMNARIGAKKKEPPKPDEKKADEKK